MIGHSSSTGGANSDFHHFVAEGISLLQKGFHQGGLTFSNFGISGHFLFEFLMIKIFNAYRTTTMITRYTRVHQNSVDIELCKTGVAKLASCQTILSKSVI